MDLIAKKYRVLKSLGQGAMGEVFLVLPSRGDPVALKLLKNLDAKSNASAMEQFENEFKVLKKLSHPNIGSIFDYGYDEDLKKVFFTLPWLRGTDAFAHTKNLDFDKCEALFVEILRALNYLHQKNLIHCDLKPGNIFVEDHHALLIDFGLAGYWGESIVGTPTYLAPEVFRGSRHNVASDLYAAGVIFFNCLTRTQPFSGKTMQEVFDRHRSFTPPPISELCPRVPKYFSDIVSTLLNKKPEERFPSAAAVIEEIAAFSKTKYSIETEQTLLSYLPTQADFIGRKDEIWSAQMAINDFLSEKVSTPYHLILINGLAGAGKSKLVDKIRNDLQLAKQTVEMLVTPLQESDQDVLMNTRTILFEETDSFENTPEEKKDRQQALSLIEQKILSPKTTRFLLVASAAKSENLKDLRTLFPEEQTKITTIEIPPFTKAEMHEFLVSILGIPEIPEDFVGQFHRNTEGMPGLATQLIQAMIEKGLLFDTSGRWNEDLLKELGKVFEKMEISESLEQQFEKTYATLSDSEAEIVNWLAICPHPLKREFLAKLTHFSDTDTLLLHLTERHIIREEGNAFLLYRGVFQAFIQENLPDNDRRKRHSTLALPDTGLDNKWRIYHLSQGTDFTLALRARVKLAEIYEKEGDKEKAFETYLQLTEIYKTSPYDERVDWFLKASSLLIWMNRFKDADELLTQVEQDIQKHKAQISMDLFLTLLEKKGMTNKHQEQLEMASLYFDKGLKLAERLDGMLVHQMRFHNNLAEVELMLGHHNEAIDMYRAARELGKNLSQDQLEKITNNDLGHVYLQLQKYDEAIHFLREDMRIIANLKKREPLVRTLYSYGLALRAKGQPQKAIQAMKEGIRLSKEGSIWQMLLRLYNALGNLHLSMKDNADAIKNYQKAVEIAVRIGETTSKAALLVNQGYIYLQEKNWALATRRYMMAKQILENKPHRLSFDEMLLSKCYGDLAALAIQEKNTMKALSYQLERLKIVEDSQTMLPEKFNIKLELAEIYLDNRLRDQFLNVLQDLQTLANSPEETDKVVLLRTKWEALKESGNVMDQTSEIPWQAVQ
jgi:serine/threonine protein kinase/Tfp pilus assembly protein PilF